MTTDTATFTRTAAALVARNDRRAWLRGLRRALRRAASTAGLGWSALVLAAVVLGAAAGEHASGLSRGSMRG